MSPLDEPGSTIDLDENSTNALKLRSQSTGQNLKACRAPLAQALGGHLIADTAPVLLAVLLVRLGDMVISDAAHTALSTAAVSLELHPNAACATQMPLAEALAVGPRSHDG